MNSVEAALRRVTADLDRRRLGWALVGGFAVSARAEPRFTRDVDVAVVTQRATRSLPHWEAPLHHRRGAGGELDRRPQERGQVVRPSRGDEVAVDDYFGVLPLGSRVAQIIGDRRG